MDPKHKEIAEGIYQAAIFGLAETGVDMPVISLIKDDKCIPILIPPLMEITMEEYTSKANEMAKEENADAILMIAGMWVVKGRKGELDLTERPSESPNREEHLNLVYMSANGNVTASISGEIKTNVGTGTKYVEKYDWMDSVSHTNFFEPWKL